MNVIQGKDVDLFVLRDGDFVPIGCATDLSFEMSQDLIEVTTKDSGRARDYEAGFRGYSVRFSGLVTLDDTAKFQFFDFLNNPEERLTLHIDYTDPNGLSKTIEGDYLIEGASYSGNVDDFAGADISMKGCGEMSYGATGIPGTPSPGLPYTLPFTL